MRRCSRSSGVASDADDAVAATRDNNREAKEDEAVRGGLPEKRDKARRGGPRGYTTKGPSKMLSERDPQTPRRLLKGAKTMQGSLFRHVPVSHKPHLHGQSIPP